MTRRSVGWWLAIWAAMVLLLVVIGGITRLTDSGLSITEWRPIAGAVPPLTGAAWNEEFAKYRQIPEYRLVYPDMTLEGFKRIYLWEFVHRLWARLVGAALLIPLVVFWLRGAISRPLRGRLVVLVFLMAGQGALGWYMVRSGLSARVDVSQYRLAAHMSLALVIYATAVWTAADILWGDPKAAGSPRFRRGVTIWTGMVFLTAVAGAFVAGLRAGKVFNEFPLMAGHFIPPGYWNPALGWANLFDNVATVQFHHRWLGVSTALIALGIAGAGFRSLPVGRIRTLTQLAGFMAIVQVTLGIVTLLGSVPIPPAAAHQTGAVLLFTLALLIRHEA